MKPLLSLLLAPTIALAGAHSGSILDFDGHPIPGVTVRLGADSTRTAADGTYSLTRTAGITAKSPRPAAMSHHLSLAGRHPTLSYQGADISGRGQHNSIPCPLERPTAARSLETQDTLRVYWKGAFMLRLLVDDSTSRTQTVRIDTAWESWGFLWNPLAKPGTVAARSGSRHLRIVTVAGKTWTADVVASDLSVSSIDTGTARLCPIGFGLPSGWEWQALIDSMGHGGMIQDTLNALGFPIWTNFLGGTPYSNPSNGGFIQIDVIEPYTSGGRSYDVWMSGRTKYATTNLRCIKR